MLLAGVAVVLLVAGSGDGRGDGEETAGRPSEAVSTGEPVVDACRASNVEIATAQRALLAGNDSPGAVEGFLGDAFVDLTRDRSQALRALDPEPEVLDLLDEQDGVVDAIAADPAAAAAAETNPFDAVNRRWRDLGLAECAIDSSTVRLDG